MPISFLSHRHRAQRLGRVRLGYKVFKCANPECGEKIRDTGEHSIECPHCGRVSRAIKRTVFPAAAPHFVLNDAPALKEFYGEQPTALNIEFLWDNLEFTFPHYMRRYTASGLKCLGDGEMCYYRVNPQGEVDTRDGNAVHPNGKVVMTEDEHPVKVRCPGELCPYYEDGSCKPTGYLRFLPTEAPRLGYYDLVCHQRAVVGILTQLKLTLALFHHITGIPFILHRGEEEKVPVKVPGKGMVDMPIRTQWIEIDPAWFAENFPMREQHLALAAAKVRQDMIELFGEDSDGDSAVPTPATEEAAAPAFEGEGSPPESMLIEATGEVILAGGLGQESVKRDVDSIETLGDLWTACLEDFGLNRTQALRELGVTSQEHLAAEPRDLYLQIAAVRSGVGS